MIARHARGTTDRLRSIMAEHRRARNAQVIRAMLPLVAERVGQTGRPASGWLVDSVAATRTAAAVAMLRHPASEEQLVMRVASGPAAAALERSASATRQVRSALRDSCPFGVATPLLLVHVDDDVVTVETRLPGGSYSAAGLDETAACQCVAAAIGELYRVTAATTTVTPELAARVVAADQLAVRSRVLTRRLGEVAGWAVARLQETERLVGRTHGDLNLSNALFLAGDPVGVSLVDWDASLAHGLPALDGISLVLDARQRLTGSETGALVREVLEHGYAPDERRLLAAIDPGATDPLMTWVWWLSFIAHCVQSTPRLRSHPYWLHHNVAAVLALSAVGP